MNPRGGLHKLISVNVSELCSAQHKNNKTQLRRNQRIGALRRRDYEITRFLQVRRVLCYRKNDEEDEEVREVSERIGCALYESANYKN